MGNQINCFKKNNSVIHILKNPCQYYTYFFSVWTEKLRSIRQMEHAQHIIFLKSNLQPNKANLNEAQNVLVKQMK